MNNINPSNFFNYYRDCYKLDYKEFTVNNILSQKYKFKWFSKRNEQLINQNSPIIYYDNRDIDKLEKELHLFNLEKSLYYGAFFILGKEALTGLNKDPFICSPLIMYPCEVIEKDGDKFLKINQNDFLLNTSILNKVTDNTVDKEKLEDKLHELFSNKIEDAFDIKKAFDAYGENIDTSDLTFYPENWNINRIRKQLKNCTLESPLKIIPASGTIFIEKSISSTKIINDLSGIAKKNVFTSALQELFNQDSDTNEISDSLLENRLNPEQLNALTNSQEFLNSIIIGPPGTGKSYSISAIAVDAILKNQSVLIVSKTKQAVEVIRENLIKDFGLNDILIHTSGIRFKISLKAKIRRRLSGIVPRSRNHSSNIHSLQRKSESLTKKYKKLVSKELALSELTFKEELSFKDHFRKLLLQFNKNDNLEFLDTIQKLNSTSNGIIAELKNYVRHKTNKTATRNASKNRTSLGNYSEALNASSFSESQAIIEKLDFSKILEIFPLWLAHLSELNTVFPQDKEIFDLVIIDEATQCDIATALPAIYRAKRVVICGDPNQLRHYSFVGKAQQYDLLNKYKLEENPIYDYRNKSILDVYLNKVSNQKQVTFLREHYRSTPSLIEFNNQEFYDEQLEIIKSTTEFTNKKQVEIKYLDGTRNKKGINEEEASIILDKISELIANSEQNQTVPSIGVITPFSDQARFINKLVGNKFNLKTIKKFNFLCGTPYNFQGSEREIILISFNVCKNTHHSAFTHLNKSEVLNVGTTRAKSFQYIYTSIDKTTLNKTSLFYKYLDFIENYQYQHGANDNVQDLFQKEVASFLNSINVTDTNCGYPYAGSILDIFFTYKNKNYFIDLIGYPGVYNNAFSIERYKTFNRVGINTIPLHYRFWKENNKQAKDKILQLINN
jgi:superfamily I DNA and/or RNA helicase